jgi:hypothetical protein
MTTMILAYIQSASAFFLIGLLCVFVTVNSDFTGAQTAFELPSACPSGRSAARLTGWMLNNKTPVGKASFDEGTKSLEVTVESVALPDGTRLSVLIGEEKIGDMEPLKDGSARVVLTRAVADQARVRVLNADRPIVSANLQCVTTPATSAPTPTPSVSPSPVQTLSPGPTVEPTPDPMPKRSPVPTPSPK